MAMPCQTLKINKFTNRKINPFFQCCVLIATVMWQCRRGHLRQKHGLEILHNTANTQTNSLPKHPGQTSETLSMIWLLWLVVTHINCRGLQNLATAVKADIWQVWNDCFTKLYFGWTSKALFTLHTNAIWFSNLIFRTDCPFYKWWNLICLFRQRSQYYV